MTKRETYYCHNSHTVSFDYNGEMSLLINAIFNYISSYNNLISFSIASYLYVREEKANVSAIVYLQLCGFCSEGFPLSLGAWDRLGI